MGGPPARAVGRLTACVCVPFCAPTAGRVVSLAHIKKPLAPTAPPAPTPPKRCENTLINTLSVSVYVSVFVSVFFLFFCCGVFWGVFGRFPCVFADFKGFIWIQRVQMSGFPCFCVD